MVRARVLVRGRVQGVGFRAWVLQLARREELSGWVRNLSDGRVQAEFEGDAAAVQRAIEACRRGPSSSRVEQVDVDPSPTTGYGEGFEIVATAFGPHDPPPI